MIHTMNDLITQVTVSEDDLDPHAAFGMVADDRAGAAVLFTGTVRNHAPGKTGVSHLEYEAYSEQVVDKIMEIVNDARERWDIYHVVVEHRTGVVAVGGVSVVVAVSSAHRGDSFGAGQFIIDELKHRVPIWKKEHWPGGAEWVEGA